MPLSKARDRGRKRLIRREYQWRKRGSKQGLNNGSKHHVKTHLEAQGLTLEANRIVSAKKGSVFPSESIRVPLYNPSVHKPGDRVLIKPPYSKKLIEMTIPNLDADGNPYYD